MCAIDVQLKGQNDQKIWLYAADNGYTIVTKDDDFRALSLLRGAPPKVIWASPFSVDRSLRVTP